MFKVEQCLLMQIGLQVACCICNQLAYYVPPNVWGSLSNILVSL